MQQLGKPAVKQEVDQQEINKQDTAVPVHGAKITAPQIVEEAVVVPTSTPAPAPKILKTLQTKTIEIFIEEVVKVAAGAKAVEVEAFAVGSGRAMKEKIQAKMDFNAKISSANELSESKLKAKGVDCNDEQLKNCGVPLKELLDDCIARYADDKCSDEAFDVVINVCVGKCSSELTDIL